MRAPSERALHILYPDLDRQEVKLIRSIAKAVDDPERLEFLVEDYLPETESYVRRIYHSPYNSHLWRVTVALYAINEIVDGFGVEGLGPDVGGPTPPPYEYINAGDTYTPTLVYDRRGDRLFIRSWGDIAEQHPNW